MRDTLDLPVYQSKSFKYILMSDIKEGYIKLELDQWLGDRTRPLLQGATGTIIDAVFLVDYIEFKEYLQGKNANLN